MKKTYKIKDIDCASCALKIEHSLNQHANIMKARVDFAKSKIYIESENDLDANDLDKIAKSVDADVTVYEGNDEINHKLNKTYFSILLGILLALMAEVLIDTDMIYMLMMLTSYMLISYKIVFRAFKNIIKGHMFDEHVLMTIATIGALLLGEYIEALAVMVFYQIGEYFQNLAVNKSRKNIESLLDLKPKVAHVIVKGSVIDKHPDELMIDDLLLIKPGEQLPTDAMLIKGESTFDFSSMTGESLPVESYIGQMLSAGIINLSHAITVKVTHAFKDSSLQKMIDFVESESMKKAKAEKFMTRFAKYYTPIVVVAALILAFVMPFIIYLVDDVTYMSAFNIYAQRALIFLVISCPCALVLSIPLSFYAGIGLSSKHGLLVKSGSDLEMIKQIDHFVFDKTGTLTKGSFEIEQIYQYQNDIDVLYIAALLESQSTHPIAKSIVSAYDKPIDSSVLKDVKEHVGKGISAVYHEDKIVVGHAKLMKEKNIKLYDNPSVGLEVYIAMNQQHVATIVLKDEIKDKSIETIAYLKKHHKNVSMVTGDQEKVALDVAHTLGIDAVFAEVTPSDKANIVCEISEKEKVAFIGDGVNDAMVLISADLGFSMGTLGSDIAIEASDVVIVNDQPSKIIDAIKISNATDQNVKQNIILALGIKLLVLALGALGYANMWMAIFADVGVSLIAVLNAMRLLYVNKS